ncbi:MAG: GldG family protein [bacterium]
MTFTGSEKTARARRTRWINLLLLAGILVVLNWLGSSLFFRWDMTGRGIYSLSDASKQTVRGLEDRLTIKAYFSEDLPAQYASNARFVRDKLDEYRAYGGNDVHYEFVDPASEEELREEAQQYGIQPATVQVVEQDRMEMKQVYMALVFLYQDRTETIPLVQSTAGLEYDITTAIRRVSREDLPVVGFLQGHGMPAPREQLSRWVQELERHYQVRAVDVSGYELVPPDVEVLFIIGPTSGFDAWERYAVDQFIQRGGKTAWLLDTVDADLQRSQQGMARPLDLGMDAWLAHYGIRVKTALVMDASNQDIQVSRQQGIFRVQSVVPYPFFPVSRWFETENPMVRDLPQAAFYYVSPVDTTLAVPDSVAAAPDDTIHSWPADPPEVRVEPIIYSSEQSGLQEDFFFIQPNPNLGQRGFEGGPYALAATVTGSLSSAFEAAPAVPDTVTLPTFRKGPIQSRLVVVGDGTFPRDDYLQGPNVQLLLNMVDWLFQDEALISIRSKEVDHRPLAEVGDAARNIVKWLDILLPPALAILAGLFWWRWRRKRTAERVRSEGGEA